LEYHCSLLGAEEYITKMKKENIDKGHLPINDKDIIHQQKENGHK